MRNRILQWVGAALCGLLAACAIITVNVYFPEKDVKEAYKSLDDMLLKQQGDKAPEGVVPQRDQKKREESKPLGRFRLSLVSEAYAEDKVADDLAVELSSMPEVLKAYEELNARLQKLDALRDSGAVGESRQGLISVRDPAKLGGNEAVVKAVNDSRKVIITGMARAILKINNQPVSDKGLKQVLGKAAATYAATRQEAARPGWWIELPNGKWVQK